MESDIVYKICGKCKETKLGGEFHRNKNRADGYVDWCKKCVKEYKKQYYEDNKDTIAEQYKQYRKDNKDIVAEGKRQYRKDNKDTIAKQNKQYYEDNKGTLLERHRQYYEDNKDVIVEYSKQYRKDNKDTIAEWKRQYYKDNKGTIVERTKQYFKSPSGRKVIKVRSQNRRARKKKAEGKITKIVIQQIEENNILKYGELTCVYCGALVSNGYHLDHKKPLARGGSNTVENLAIACPTCNLRKNAKTDEEFLALLQEENTKGDKK